jgi:SIR2-like domain
MSKVVWVLGSGFSRSLGGPLLDDLFDEHRWAWARSLITDLARRRQLAQEPKILAKLERLQDIYAVVRDKKLRAPWRNAEEFLEMWEIATDDRAGSSDRERCRQLLVNIIKRCLKSPERELMIAELTAGGPSDGRARSYLVAMTHEFLHQTKPEGEKWAPYVRWAGGLTANDQIITINYDLVIERAYEAAFKEGITKTGLFAPKESRLGMLHKLHGSVDWIVSGPSSFDLRVCWDGH